MRAVDDLTTLGTDLSGSESGGRPRALRGLRRLGWLAVGGILLLALSGCRIRHAPKDRSKLAKVRGAPAAAEVEKKSDPPRVPRELRNPSASPDPTDPPEASAKETLSHDASPVLTEVLPASEDDRSPAPQGWKVFAYAGGIDFPQAVEAQTRSLLGEATAAETAARIVSALEDREDTNAGRGATVRMDGETIECAASVQDGAGRAGRVGGLRKTWNPSSTALALYRAGGARIWGPAGDELSERLGLRTGSLRTAASEQTYDLDLAQAVQSKTISEFLLPLYVSGDDLAQALKANPETFADRPLRDPVFALVLTAEGDAALAWSTGGAPFSPPGEPSDLFREESTPALQGSRAAIFLSDGQGCPTSPSSLVESLEGAFSLQFPVATLERACPASRYFIHGETESRTNLRPESLLTIDGTAEQKAALDDQVASPEAPTDGLPETESAPKKEPPARKPTAAPPLAPPKEPQPASPPPRSAPAKSPPAAPSSPPTTPSTEAKPAP